MKSISGSPGKSKWDTAFLLVGVLIFYMIIASREAIRIADPMAYTQYAYEMFYDFSKVIHLKTVFANRIGHTFPIMSGIIPFGLTSSAASFFLILISLYTAYRFSLIIKPQGADKVLYVLLFF